MMGLSRRKFLGMLGLAPVIPVIAPKKTFAFFGNILRRPTYVGPPGKYLAINRITMYANGLINQINIGAEFSGHPLLIAPGQSIGATLKAVGVEEHYASLIANEGRPMFGQKDGWEMRMAAGQGPRHCIATKITADDSGILSLAKKSVCIEWAEIPIESMKG